VAREGVSPCDPTGAFSGRPVLLAGMKLGVIVGRAILVGLDALAAGALAGLVGLLAAPVLWVGDRVVLGLIAAGVGAGVTLAVALALAGLGRRPFPATRLAKTALHRLPRWLP
jgi:hypothetical protein